MNNRECGALDKREEGRKRQGIKGRDREGEWREQVEEGESEVGWRGSGQGKERREGMHE